MAWRTIAVFAALAAFAVVPVSAEEIENAERCNNPLASCITTAQDFSIERFFELVKTGNMTRYTLEEFIQNNGWQGVTEEDVIPAGTRVYL